MQFHASAPSRLARLGASALALALCLTFTANALAQDNPRRIYRAKGEIRSPAVSPDGKTLVYSVWQEKRYAHKLRFLTIGKRVKARDSGWGVGAAFSADGSQLLYLSEAKGDGKYWITISDPKGSNARDLGFEGSNPEGNPPAWSPDGTQILLVNPAGSYLIPVEGKEGQRISVKTLGNGSWSPDGKHIVYEAKGGGISTLTVGAGTTEALTRKFQGFAGKWAPDGKHIAWVGEEGVVVFNVATGKRKTVGEGTRFVWTHDGAGLLLLAETGEFTQGATTPVPDLSVSWVGLDGKAPQPIAIPKVHHAITGENGRTVFFAVHNDGIYRMRLPEPGTEASKAVPDGPARKTTPSLPIKRPGGRKIDADTLKAIQ